METLCTEKCCEKLAFSHFMCKMSMLPKAARPFGTKISIIVKNGETQINKIIFFQFLARI